MVGNLPCSLFFGITLRPGSFWWGNLDSSTFDVSAGYVFSRGQWTARLYCRLSMRNGKGEKGREMDSMVSEEWSAKTGAGWLRSSAFSGTKIGQGIPHAISGRPLLPAGGSGLGASSAGPRGAVFALAVPGEPDPQRRFLPPPGPPGGIEAPPWDSRADQDTASVLCAAWTGGVSGRALSSGRAISSTSSMRSA